MSRMVRVITLLLIVPMSSFCTGCLFDTGSDVVAGIAEGDLPPYIVDGQFEPLALDWLTPLGLLGVPHQNVVQKTRQNQTIFGWFLPTEDPAGTVLIHHGAVTNRSAVLTNVLFLRHFGYNVLVYDYQGFGEDVADQLAPVLQRAIRRHDRRAELVASHDDLEQILARAFGQLLHAHVVDRQQIGLEIFQQHLLLSGQGLVVQEVADHVEDRAVQHDKAALDRLVAEGLDQMTLTRPRRPEQQHVASLTDLGTPPKWWKAFSRQRMNSSVVCRKTASL